MEALTSYGNTASAFGRNIMDFTEALSNAVMFNFRSLRSFGIMAKTEKDTVEFTFQGITTTVAKNAKAIEAYLRSLGDVQFAGAMKEQMDTMGGVMQKNGAEVPEIRADISDTVKNIIYRTLVIFHSHLVANVNNVLRTFLISGSHFEFGNHLRL